MPQPGLRRTLFPLLLLAAAPATAGSELARYSFDDELTATGPDTFRVFRDAKGSVALSTAFHWSGYHAVELRDVAGNRDFPELQGYFPLRRDGWVTARFALLTTDPKQELNVALAGPRWFTLGKDGIAVWLATRDGWLFQISDSIPKRLLALKPFTWYEVEVAYDVAAGRYDLRIAEEGVTEPVVSLAAQANAAAQPGSAVDKFSFIGDNGDDRSNVTYYVDDVLIAADRPVSLPPFRAPGRRKFFVDLLGERRDPRTGPLACPPELALEELGVGPADFAAWRAGKQLDRVEALLAGGGAPPVRPSDPAPLRAVAAWRQGCAALARGEGARALERFDAAAALAPAAPLPPLGRLLALVALARWPAVDALLAELHPRWQHDPRYAVAAAYAGARRGDLEEARRWVEGAASGEIAGSAARLLAGEQLFALLMVEGRHAEARDYALAVARRLAERPEPARAAAAGGWLERAGDAAFQARDPEEARSLYQRAVRYAEDPTGLLLKLADAYYLLGDLAAEKALRERIYGTLDAD